MRIKRFLVCLLVCCVIAASLPAIRADATTEAAQMSRLREIYTTMFPASDPDNDPSYFTVSGQACAAGTGDSCDNCSLENILAKLYSQNNSKFGTAYQVYNENPMNGYTCVAFQRFVWLYVFGAREWDSNHYTNIFKNAAPTYSNFSKLLPGDAVYYYTAPGSSIYHNAIFLSCDATSVTFLDCNWTNGGKYGKAIVRVRELQYDAIDQYVFRADRSNKSVITGNTVGDTTEDGYDGAAAVAFAKKYNKWAMTTIPWAAGWDVQCAEFVARCVIAGGLPLSGHSDPEEQRQFLAGTGDCLRAIESASGLKMEDFTDYHGTSRIPKASAVQAGDILGFWCYDCEICEHLMICSGEPSEQNSSYAKIYERNSTNHNDFYKFDQSWSANHSNCSRVGAKIIRLSSLSSENAVVTVNIDPTLITLPVGGTFDFTSGGAMEGTSLDADDLTWRSTNTAAATVLNGKVTAKAAGETVISAQAGTGQYDTVTVRVVQPNYNCAEQWTVKAEDGLSTWETCNLNGTWANTFTGGRYQVPQGGVLVILEKRLDENNNLWGFGCGYNNFLAHRIYGWFNLENAKLGDEQHDFSHYPEKPVISIEKTGEDTVVVRWDSADRATHYDLYQDGTLVKAGITGTSAEVSMTSGSTSEFCVEAVNGNFPCKDLFDCKTASETVSFTQESEIVKFDFVGNNMTLGNELILNFMFKKSDLPNGEGVYAVLTHKMADGKEDKVKTVEFDAETWSYNKTYYFVSMPVYASQMADDITVVLYNAKGQAISNPKTCSVRTYLMNNIDKSSFNAKMKTVAVDMLNYGAASQEYNNYNVSDLANNLLNDTQKAYGTPSSAAVNRQIKGEKFAGANLSLLANIELNIMFTGYAEGRYAEVTYTNFKGEEVSCRVAGTSYSSGKYTSVKINTLRLSDGDTLVNVVLYNADGTVYGTGSDSVDGYARRQLDKTSSDLYEMVSRLTASAKAYALG